MTFQGTIHRAYEAVILMEGHVFLLNSRAAGRRQQHQHQQWKRSPCYPCSTRSPKLLRIPTSSATSVVEARRNDSTLGRLSILHVPPQSAQTRWSTDQTPEQHRLLPRCLLSRPSMLDSLFHQEPAFAQKLPRYDFFIIGFFHIFIFRQDLRDKGPPPSLSHQGLI